MSEQLKHGINSTEGAKQKGKEHIAAIGQVGRGRRSSW